MNDEISNEILKAVKPLIDRGTSGILKMADAIIEESPEIVKQLLKWEFTKSLILFIFVTLFVIVLGIFAYKWCKYIYHIDNWVDGDIPKNLIYVTIWATYFLVSSFLIVINASWLKILIAPKLYLINYVSFLIRSGG